MEYLKKKVFYWSPSLVDIATNKAVINSAYSLLKYNNKFESSIINFFGEFSKFERDIIEKKIKLISHFNNKIIKFLPKYGKLKSRLSFIVIYLLSFLPLKKLLEKEKPDYLIVQLITSLPLTLLILFNFKTKFILRISGLPRLNFFRKILWKIASKKIYAITCPTNATKEKISELKIIEDNKIFLLYDPVVIIKDIPIERKKKFLNNKVKKKYFLSAGRFTSQKNFFFLSNEIKNFFEKESDYQLLIAGEGEEKKKIIQYINKNNLNDKIILLGHVKNLFYYMNQAEVFILSSLWEDPGFVIIEAAFAKTLVLSSDCYAGPKELIKDNINGVLFNSNNSKSFQEKLQYVINLNKEKKMRMIKKNILESKKFTILSHYKSLQNILK